MNRKIPNMDVLMVGGPDDGNTLSIPVNAARVGRFDLQGELWTYDVDKDSATATVVAE